MPKNGRCTEEDIAVGVLWVLAGRPTRQATFRTLVKEIPKHVALSAADQAVSKTRPNEEMWEQQVRNITSHFDAPGNYIYEGYLERVKDGLRITDSGMAHIESLRR